MRRYGLALVMLALVTGCGSKGDHNAASTTTRHRPRTTIPASTTAIATTTTTVPPSKLYAEMQKEIERACNAAIYFKTPPQVTFDPRWASVSTEEKLLAAAQKCVDIRITATTTVIVAPTVAPTTAPPTPPAPTSPQMATVNGHVRMLWSAQTDLETDGPITCDSYATSIQVQIRNGTGATVAVAPFGRSQTVDESRSNGLHSVTCDYPYSVAISPAAVITSALMDPHSPTPLKTVTANASGSATTMPVLFESWFCLVDGGCGFDS